MLKYLRYYNYLIIRYTNLINKKNNAFNFSYSEYLGHIFFTNFSIEIGGLEISSYENDYLHINQLHKIKQEALPNYYEMIGNIPELYNFDNNTKGNSKIIIPLVFWFNKDAGASLPLISLQYADIIINTKINQLYNIITFENYDDLYNNLLNITIDFNSLTNLNFNYKLIYNNYQVNEFNIIYNCIYINNELLKLQFPNLSSDDRLYILQTFGSTNILLLYPKIIIDDIIDNYYINVYQWIHFMNELKNNLPLAYKLALYYPYVDYNKYYSLIDNPKIKLITEVVYLDDIEREKFANNKLEYIIETIDSDIYNNNYNNHTFTCDLSFTQPCKELLWYIQPQIYYNNLNKNGKNKSLIFTNTDLSTNNIIDKQRFLLNNYDVLLENIDDNYYTYALPYKLFNNTLVPGIYYHSFCLYPEDTQPSGTVNLRYIKGKSYILSINNLFINDYTNILKQLNELNKTNFIIKFISKNYQLLVISNGTANFLFV